MAQAESARLRVQHRARAHPAQQRGSGHVRHEFLAHRADLGDLAVGRHDAAVRQRHVDTGHRQLLRHHLELAGGDLQDHADLGLGGLHVLELVHVEDLRGERRHLVRGHHPGAEGEHQRELAGERGRAKAPGRYRLHPARSVEYDVDCGRAGVGHRLVVGRLAGEAGAHVLAQLVGVVGQAHEGEVRHRARVQASVPDREAV